MTAANCPSCGASVEFHSTISVVAVCSHCRTGLIRKDLNLETFGKVADLRNDKSRLQLGVRGEHQKVSFLVVGRIQMGYDGGHWNEWCLSFNDGRYGWLGEASGNYSVSFPIKSRETIPSEDALKIGQEIKLNGKAYTVMNLEEASYLSAEGELPTPISLEESSLFADLGSSDGSFATLDFSESPPLVFAGAYVSTEDLKLQGMKEPAR